MLAAMPVMAAYTGRVYVDKNKNGVFDPGEKTWAGKIGRASCRERV